MEWSNEMCLQLIDLYEKYPVLWDPKHGFHYSKTKKNDAWEAIASAIQVDSKQVKQKMTSLLGSFRRERAKGKKTVGTGTGTYIYISQYI